MTRLLVLGGGSFVGWAAAVEGRARGWSVTCATRGNLRVPADTAHRRLDRAEAGSPELPALAEGHDVVVDTWSGDPRAVAAAARALAGAVRGYCYVSTRSVYRAWLPGGDESAPTVDPLAGNGYPEWKRRAEIAVIENFPQGHLVLRPGVILGPRENLERVAWWRDLMEDTPVRLTAGPEDLPVQVVDVRDLAGFALDGLAAGTTGVFDVAAPPTTLSEIEATFAALTNSSGRPVWADPARVQELGYRPWTSFPLWVPRGHPTFGFFGAGCVRAREHGLTTRTLVETLAASLPDPAETDDAVRCDPDRTARRRLRHDLSIR